MLTELLYPLQGGYTPLHLALKGDHTTCVEQLLSIPGIDVYIKDQVSWCSLVGLLSYLATNYVTFSTREGWWYIGIKGDGGVKSEGTKLQNNLNYHAHLHVNMTTC